jgi:hypothetical protein
VTDDQLYSEIWKVVAAHVGDNTDADYLTDQIWDVILEDARDTARRRSYDQAAGFMMGTMWGQR